MKILALETSAKSVSTAVVENGAPLAYAYQCTGLTHSRTLMPMVDAMLKNAELTLGDMDAVAVAAGPGSFTGLRIGIAAVKGLAWAADKPCFGVSTLEAMARSRSWRRSCAAKRAAFSCSATADGSAATGSHSSAWRASWLPRSCSIRTP